MRRLAQALACLLALSCATACLAPNRSAQAVPREALSPKLDPFIFFEEGGALFVGVDGRAAQYTKKGSIFPLGLGLVNHQRTTVEFGRESFVLESADGRRYPLVSVEEFNRDYNRSQSDDRLGESLRTIMLSRYGQGYRFQPWTPFPASFRGGATNAPDRLQLGRANYTVTYLYFPIPASGLHGETFTLIVTPYESDESYLVDFSIR